MPSKERLAQLQAKMDAAREKQKKIQEQLRQAESQVRKEERKQRTRELIEIGGLAELADIRRWERPVILGMMLDAAKSSDTQRESWRRTGIQVLSARAAEKKLADKSRAPVTPKQPKPPSAVRKET
jgi:multidrug resistance efflux pump